MATNVQIKLRSNHYPKILSGIFKDNINRAQCSKSHLRDKISYPSKKWLQKQRSKICQQKKVIKSK